jgi:hypothetical protein
MSGREVMAHSLLLGIYSMADSGKIPRASSFVMVSRLFWRIYALSDYKEFTFGNPFGYGTLPDSVWYSLIPP